MTLYCVRCYWMQVAAGDDRTVTVNEAAGVLRGDSLCWGHIEEIVKGKAA